MILSVVFTSFGFHTGLGQFLGLPPIARKHLPRWLQSRLGTSVGDVVELHLSVLPMGWNWAAWFAQQMLEHVLLDEAGETTLSPTPLWDDNPVVKLFF